MRRRAFALSFLFLAAAACEFDGDHAAVGMHRVDTAVREQSPGDLVDGPVTLDLLAGDVALVAHAGERPVDLEPDDARLR